MNVIVHHLKTEYMINSKVMWFTLAVLLALCYALAIDTTGVESVQIIWYNLVAGMVTSAAYKKDFSLKYFAGLPVERDKLIIMMIAGRLVYFVPGAITLSVYYHSLPKDPLLNHSWPLFIITYFIFVSVFNAMQLLGDIETPRIESVPSRFESFLMFFKKIAINYILGGTILVGGFLFFRALIVSLGLEILNNQFLLVIYGGAVLTFLMYRCHQVFLNEHLSYWSWKRDGLLAGFFIIAAVFPAIAYKKKLAALVYHNGDSPYFMAVTEEKPEKVRELFNDGVDPHIKNELGYTPALSALRRGKVEVLLALEEIGASIGPEDLVSPSALAYPPIEGKLTPLHLAILSNKVEMLNFVAAKPGQMDLMKHKEVKLSPIQLAAERCYPGMIAPLANMGFDLNQRTHDKSTPLIKAVKADCYGAVVELASLGASLNLKDAQGKTVFDYAKGRQMEFFLGKFSSEKIPQNRLPASTNLDFLESKR